MSRIDLHVDELFDGARTGTLSTLEAARLQAHCQQCVACRAELGWIGDGLHLGTASDADRERGARAVEALLGGAGEAQQAATSRSSGRARAATVSRWQAAALVCLGLLMASAGAALYTEVQAWRAREAATVARARSSERASETARAKSQRLARTTPARDPAPVEPSAPIVVPDVPSAALPAVAGPEPRRLQPPAAPSPTAASTLDRTRSIEAEALFARANGERTVGELERALALYQALAQAYPETRSALASRISRAELLLRRMHSPAEALVAYRSYLTAAPDGPLAEEARVGVATCAQQLGQDDEERKAWLELLERHPGSLHAERAHARLRALSP